jgi:hypothetical protein
MVEYDKNRDNEDQGVVGKKSDMDNGQSVCVCMTIRLGEVRVQNEHLRAGQGRGEQGRAEQSRA